MNFNELTSYINEYIKKYQLPYFSIIIRKNNEVLYRYLDTGRFLHMHSLSKMITCVALLQLVDKKMVSLDDPVYKYLPAFKNVKYKNSGKKVETIITVKHLLTMTSGMDYDVYSKTIKDYHLNHPNASIGETCESFIIDGINSEPGKEFRYSLSLDVVAAIVEIVSKQKFSSYLDEHIFIPLNMKQTSFKQDDALVEQTYDEFRYNPDTKKVELSKKYYYNFFPTKQYESGGSGLLSTVDDFSLFVDDLSNEHPKILSKEMVDLMATVYVEETHFDASTNEYSKSSDEYGYGLAVRVRKIASKNGIPVGEFGWDGSAGCYALCDRTNNISIVIGMSIQAWPSYIKSMHIDIANKIYEVINK